MSQDQWKRLDAVHHVELGRLTVGEAAQVVGLSRRQMRRVRSAVAEKGEAGVMHGNHGRAPWNRRSEAEQRRVAMLFRTRYAGFNDQHFTEKLGECESLKVSRATVQRWLRAAGLGAARKRRPPKHRRRRDRKPQAGMMILWDGSRHAWLEDRGPMLCLVGAVDDATSELLPGAHFVEQECAAAYLRTLRAIVREKGVPWSAYMDQHGSLRRNDDHWTIEEELRGEQDPTQVGRALKELGIEVIFALSPQAKGRVERVWGTLQDRLVSELRLAGARTLAEANAVLTRSRGPHNRKFAVPAADAQPAWRAAPKGLDLDRACAFRYEATVQNDNTVRRGGRIFDVPPGPAGRSWARSTIELRQLLDGSWRIYAQDRIIARAPATGLGEIRALKQRKRSAASRAFRKAVHRVAVSLP